MIATMQQQQQTNTGSSSASATIWDHAKTVGKRASIAGHKAKTKTDIALLDSKIKTRKQVFGTELYDILAKSTEHDPMFMIIGDDNNNSTNALENIRGLFVVVYKNNKALEQRIVAEEDKINELEEEIKKLQSRHGNRLSYEVPADSFGERLLRQPAMTRIRAALTKHKTTIKCYRHEITTNTQSFCIDCFDHILKLEQYNRWLPNDQNVRYVYDSARRDIAQYQLLKEEKYEDIDILDDELQ